MDHSLNCNAQKNTFLEGNMGERILDLGLSNHFLEKPPKAQATMAKINR